MKNVNLISNPPYNIKWNPEQAQSSWVYSDCELPPRINANFAFVMRGLELATRKSAFILPCGVLSSEPEKNIRKYLIDKGLLSAVILLPEKMFESTSIPVCVLIFDKACSNKNILFMDLREQAINQERLQRGQWGGASHTGRVYKKYFNALSDDIIQEVTDLLNDSSGFIPEWARLVIRSEITGNDYNLNVGRYFQINSQEKSSRDLSAIIDDLNMVIKLRNVCKLVINHKVADRMGMSDFIENFNKSKELTSSLQEPIEKLTGKKLIQSDYLTVTKNKNELSFINNDAEIISEIFISIFQMYKQHLMFLNNQENRYLVELRDALLPKLMSGEIDVEAL